LLVRLISFLKTLYNNRYMIKSFALADLKKKYTGSMGGVLWSVLNPLMTILTLWFIFSFIFGMKVKADYGNTSFALWLMGGLLPWFFFSETVTRATGALNENKSLITKTLFPSEIIPVCLIVAGTINHLIVLCIVFIFSLFISGGLSVFSFFMVIYFVLMSIMVLGFSWGLSSLNVFVRDISHVVGIVMNLWFYYTPIFYPVSAVPEKYRLILKLNPMYHVVFSVTVFVVGGLLYKRLKPAFADVL
jgi:lipopolysaccharide transport system permease protein